MNMLDESVMYITDLYQRDTDDQLVLKLPLPDTVIADRRYESDFGLFIEVLIDYLWCSVSNEEDREPNRHITNGYRSYCFDTSFQSISDIVAYFDVLDVDGVLDKIILTITGKRKPSNRSVLDTISDRIYRLEKNVIGNIYLVVVDVMMSLPSFRYYEWKEASIYKERD
jgi:hypothetical protein